MTKTPEEQAEEWVDNIDCCRNEIIWDFRDMNSVREAFLAGYKAGKHDAIKGFLGLRRWWATKMSPDEVTELECLMEEELKQ